MKFVNSLKQHISEYVYISLEIKKLEEKRLKILHTMLSYELPQGKYKGMTLKEVFLRDQHYAEWWINSNLPNEEYEHTKKECWLDIANYCGFVPTDHIKQSAFNSVFDTAYALGKQEKDAETVISGWVCRDKTWDKRTFASDLCLAMKKPTRVEEYGQWSEMGNHINLDTNLFPDLTWNDDPELVEIILKRKNK